MKKLSFFLPLLFLNLSTTNLSLTKAEREVAVKYFNESREFFLNDVKGLSPEQLSFKAAPEKWSVAQCIEHIAIAEKALMEVVQNNLHQPLDSVKRPDVKVEDTAIWPFVTDRSKKRSAPEFLRPSDQFATTDDAIKAFLERRQKNIDYVQTTTDDLRSHFMPHSLGMLDDYQWLIVIAAHCRRHTLQIEEVKADPNFPKK